MRFFLYSCIFILFSLLNLKAQDIDFERAAGNNIGKTEEDDGDPEEVFNDQLGDLGATILKVKFDQPGEATMALYTKEGQLVRILGQVIPVEAREYRLRWDGLDLFGNLVPKGTELELKTFFNPGIQVTYEMAIRPPKVSPWPGHFQKQEDNHRFGGWLGDHSTPHGATAIGGTVFLGYKLAEEGQNMVGVNPQGEVVWAHKLEGWTGPSLMNSNGTSIVALNSKGKSVYRIEPNLKYSKRKDKERWEVQKTRLMSGSGFRHLTAHGNDLLVMGYNKVAVAKIPHPRAFSNRQIDFIKSIPQELNSSPPSAFHISPQNAFGSTFTNGGSPQVGATMVPHDGYAFILLALKTEQEIGSVVIPKFGKDVGKVEVLTLKEGVTYTEKMAPNAGSGGDGLMSLTLDAQGTEWVTFGSSTLPQAYNWINGKEKTRTTAVLIKAYPKGRAKANWKPRIPMARILAHPVQPSSKNHPVVSTSTKMKNWNPNFGTRTGWKGVTEFPISESYPLFVVQDYGEPITFNTIMAVDARTTRTYIDILREGVQAKDAKEDDWTEIGVLGRFYNKKLGHKTSSAHFFDRYVQFKENFTTTAIRYRLTEGYKKGKWGKGEDNPSFSETEHMQPLQVARKMEATKEAPQFQLYWLDVMTGETKQSWIRPEYEIGTFDFAPDGTLYAVANGRLNTVKWDRTTGEFLFSPLGNERFETGHTLFMDVDKDRIAISDSNAHIVRVFDRKGKALFNIGTGDHRKPGKWNHNVVDRPRGVALPSNGDIWISENSFAPKRISRFDRKGNFKEDFLGPPMYGGGGRLDEDGKRMFYRGMEFVYDFEKGTSELVGLYDRPYATNTPAASSFTFGGIPYSNSVYVNGNRYLVGWGIISRKLDSEPKAIPAVVYGWASDNKFFQHEVWKEHWSTQNLKGKYFVWCDHNEDGQYQIEEVELADGSSLPKGGGGGTVGPGLSLWGRHARWTPSRFTPKGVPIFETRTITPFNYDELAPHYPRNYTLSGKTSAKPTYGGFRYISTDGYLAQEGQPFVVKPDGTILGGPPPKRSDYMPEIPGQRVQTAWSWAGGAMTDSPVGEIAIINSFKGAWHIWGVKHGVMLGRFFTKEEGTYNGMPPVRGTDVTKRYMGWEGWHADFVKTRDGRYLAQGGKSFHSINEVHGLDDYRILSQPFTVGANEASLAAQLRPVLKARFYANEGHSMPAYADKIRLHRSFQLDGLIEDWGDRGQFTFMDEKERTTRFDLSYNSKGLLIALDGRGRLAGEAPNWKAAISEGFAIDLQIRRAGKRIQGNPNIVEGDTRIFISKIKGKWRGILYRPLTGTGAKSPFQLPSPFLDLNAEEFRLLNESEIGIHIREASLDVDVLDIGSGPGGFDMGELGGGLMLDSEKTGGETKMGEGQNWTAELLLPWSIIGSGAGDRRFDIGIREAGKDGRWFYWNNRYPGPRDQIELHLHLNPRSWGKIGLYSRKE